jgi:hypothetical protein
MAEIHREWFLLPLFGWGDRSEDEGMFHPDLLAQMIRLEHAERLRDAERARRLRRRAGVGEVRYLAPPRRVPPVSGDCDADAA